MYAYSKRAAGLVIRDRLLLNDRASTPSLPTNNIDMSERYTYEELPAARSIRLLTLLSRGPEPLHCSLKTVLLEEAPNYTALSYCWGSPEGTIPINCGEEGKTIYITPNLNAFLKQLSISPQEKIPEYLWIDAICINQVDIPERGVQVSIMGKIYRLAEQVTVWLGEGTEESDLAIDWSLDMYHYAKSKILLPDGCPRPSSYSDPDNPLLPYSPVSNSLRNFQYFKDYITGTRTTRHYLDNEPNGGNGRFPYYV